VGHAGPAYSVVFSPDDRTLASGGADGLIVLWDVKARQRLDEPLRGHTEAVTSLAFNQFIGLDRAYEPTCPDLPPG
jgi:WD40 repeat protein